MRSAKDLTETIARQPNGQPRRKFDVSRAERYFGFRSQVNFEEGLWQTIEWYQSVWAAGPIATLDLQRQVI